MIDATDGKQQIEQLSTKILPKCADKQLIMVFNKCDMMPADKQKELEQLATANQAAHTFISAKNRENTNSLESLLVKAANLPSVTQNDVIVTNVRHYEALTHALAAIRRVKQGLEMNISGDFLSQDIRECMHYLGEITGVISTDDILGNIFLNFCIGK